MVAAPRVELQAEVDGRRVDLFALVSTADGLRRWLDDADFEATVGSPCRFVLGDAVAVGKVLAVSAPQHDSPQPTTPSSVVSLTSTSLTPSRATIELTSRRR